MKILIFWDLYWRVWRKALKKELPGLKDKFNPDFVVVNVENVTSWRWPIEKHVLEIEALWVDVMTWWDHIFDNEAKIKDYIEKKDSKLIRPANFYETIDYPVFWKGYKIVEKWWKKLLVIHLIWEVFMRYCVVNPFLKVEEILKEFQDVEFDWIIVDFHKEATAEIAAMSFFLDSKASFVYGTHTHVQTNDEVVLPWGTWHISDIGMTWPFPSVIWADFGSVRKRFLTWLGKWKIEQSLINSYVVSWVCVEIEERKCKSIEKIRIRGKL